MHHVGYRSNLVKIQGLYKSQDASARGGPEKFIKPVAPLQMWNSWITLIDALYKSRSSDVMIMHANEGKH